MSYAPQDFVVTDSNRDAHTVVSDMQRWVAPVMALCGPEGSGKSHLAHVFAQVHAARILDVLELGEKLADVLLEGADAYVLELPDTFVAEEALAQLINEVLARQLRLLITTRARIAQRSTIRADLASRFKAMPEVLLHAPDDMLMEVLFAKAFTDRQLRASEEVIAYLVKRAERSGAAVLRMVAQLDAKALQSKQPITVPFVRDILADFC